MPTFQPLQILILVKKSPNLLVASQNPAGMLQANLSLFRHSKSLKLRSRGVGRSKSTQEFTPHQQNSLKYYPPPLVGRSPRTRGVIFHLRQSLRIFTCILASGGLRPPDRPVLGGVMFQGIRLITHPLVRGALATRGGNISRNSVDVISNSVRTM